MATPKLIAYYLPQYHPVPENDEWWGKGFTEWTNVTKAKPLFKGHYQPRFPADLGYYDLRLPEVRQAQAAMAKDYGVSGFCYYHYWFGNGRQMLNRPIDEIIASNKPDFPFCFCWANQSWTGHWFGADKKMLIKQEYFGDEDIEAHFEYLKKAFHDNRYIKIDGKPVFKILDICSLPDPSAYARKLKSLAVENGFKGLYLIAGNFLPQGWNPLENNFDAITDDSFGRAMKESHKAQNSFGLRLLLNRYLRWITGKSLVFRLRNTFTMKQFLKYYKIEDSPFVNFPIIVPGWDNTPRSLSKGLVIRNAEPEEFKKQLDIAYNHISARDMPPIIFIKSWNEWAEGNYLEPDKKFGFAYLKVIKDFTDKVSGQ